MACLDVVAVRSACVDIVMKVPNLPKHDEKVMGTMVGWLPGGTMGNYACATSKLGLKTGWIGNLGDDFMTDIVLDDFAKFNVDTSAVDFHPGEANTFTAVMVDPTGEKAIVVVPVLNEPKRVSDKQMEYLRGARAIYAGPYDYEFFTNLAHDAQKADVLVATDIEDSSIVTKDNYKEILKSVDIAIFNAGGFKHVLGANALEISQKELQMELKGVMELGPRLVAISLGGQGCIVADKTGVVRKRGLKVDVVDTTGAGDTFNASLTAGFLWGWPVSDIAAFANGAGALAVTQFGGRGGLATKQEVLRFLNEWRNEDEKGTQN